MRWYVRVILFIIIHGGNMAYIDVDLDQFDTDELIEELMYRGRDVELELRKLGRGVSHEFGDGDRVLEIIQDLFQKRRTGQDYSDSLDSLIWHTLGRVA